MTIDIDAIREKWATVCGPCDGGLPQACTCPTGDPRVPISALLTEVSEVTAERDQFRESARYYSAQVADLADKLHRAEQDNASHTKAATVWANENAWLRSKLADLGKPADAYHWVNLDGTCEADCPECAAIGVPTRVGTAGRTSNTDAPTVGTSPDALPTEAEVAPADRAQGPRPGQFCAKHFSWLCQAGQGRCQAEKAEVA